MTSKTDYYHVCAERLKAVAEPNRLRILTRIPQGEATVGGIAEQLELTLQSASHHLAVLHRAGFVLRERRGREVIYRLNCATGAACHKELDLGCCRLQFPRTADRYSKAQKHIDSTEES
jgi:DNA-binding transcriptional ArsR family regulator